MSTCKGALFCDALHWTIPITELATDDPARSVENYLRGMFEVWAADPRTPMAMLLRASMTCEDAAELWRERVSAEAIGPIAATVTGDDARLRAALSNAMVTAIASKRLLLNMPDLAAVDVEDILRLVVPVFRDLIAPKGESGPSPSAGSDLCGRGVVLDRNTAAGRRPVHAGAPVGPGVFACQRRSDG
ncbi:hypothetical protein [Streptomyces sp. NPDC096311]|uniref:TetR/AcrR family transcriptional regulator n=1 Tax=Streptomyces sp. NPDC096311 TaxID=3366083 RepID=UPI00380F11EC